MGYPSRCRALLLCHCIKPFSPIAVTECFSPLKKTLLLFSCFVHHSFSLPFTHIKEKKYNSFSKRKAIVCSGPNVRECALEIQFQATGITCSTIIYEFFIVTDQKKVICQDIYQNNVWDIKLVDCSNGGKYLL